MSIFNLKLNQIYIFWLYLKLHFTINFFSLNNNFEHISIHDNGGNDIVK